MKELRTTSKVIVFYDETKIEETNLKGHVLYFLPEEIDLEWQEEFFGNVQKQFKRLYSINTILKHINEIRKKYKCNSKFHFSQIRGKKWTKRDQAHLEFMNLAIESLRHRKGVVIKEPMFGKLAIILYPLSRDLSQYGGSSKKEKRMRYDETVLRMLLKGAIHYLYNNNHKVIIKDIICDSPPFHRDFDERRILWRLMGGKAYWMKSSLRSYVSISDDAEIIPRNSNHIGFTKENKEYSDANILQIADMLLGGATCCTKKIVTDSLPQLNYGARVENKQAIIAKPVKKMFLKIKRGSNFRYSSHYGSFSISKAFLENDQWNFERVNLNEMDNLIRPEQQILPFNFNGDLS